MNRFERELDNFDTRRTRESRTYNAIYYFVILYLVLFFLILPLFVYKKIPVLQQSMNPTIIGGEKVGDGYHFEDQVGVLVTKRVTYGDVIVFDRKEGAETKSLVKRVIALPGDTIWGVTDARHETEIHILSERGGAVIERVIRDESFVSSQEYPLSSEKVRLGEDEYFVMGDNRINSVDSRSFGPIKRDQIVGKVLAIYKKKGKLLWLDYYVPAKCINYYR